MFKLFVESLKLRDQQRRLKLCETGVRTHHVAGIRQCDPTQLWVGSVSPRVCTNLLGSIEQERVRGGYCSAFTRRENLALLEAKRSHVSNRANHAAVPNGPVRLC